MFEPTDKIIVEFTAAEWNVLINASNGETAQAVIEGLMQMLRQAAVVKPLIGRIAEQAAAQERLNKAGNHPMTEEEQEAAARISKDVVQRLRPIVDGSGESGAA